MGNVEIRFLLSDFRISNSTPNKTSSNDEGVVLLAESLKMYFEETENYSSYCKEHGETTAVHLRGNELQIYRLFESKSEIAESLRNAASLLPSWQESSFWKNDGKTWESIESGVRRRMKKHGRLTEIATQGVLWNERPLLVHAYKFDADPIMKLELIVPTVSHSSEELPTRMIASVLECHEYLVPTFIGTALPCYTRHEEKFLTISEYLSQKMPKSLYATQCLQRVSCHTSNGVGSRDTLREHQPIKASHSKYDKVAKT